jgi:hypothetical protein
MSNAAWQEISLKVNTNKIKYMLMIGAGIAQSVEQLATGWTSEESESESQ